MDCAKISVLHEKAAIFFDFTAFRNFYRKFLSREDNEFLDGAQPDHWEIHIARLPCGEMFPVVESVITPTA